MTDIKIWDSVGLCLQREFMQSHSNQNGTLAGHHNQPAGPATKRINMKLEKNNFVVTFKKEKEVADYFKMHTAEEQRLLWLGFFIANNYISQKLEDDGKEIK